MTTATHHSRRKEIRNDSEKRLIGELESDRGTSFSDIQAVIDTINGADGDLAAEVGPESGVVFITEIVDDHVLDKECSCGARLTGPDDVDFGTDYAPAPGAREPAPAQQRVPAAECSECGESVGAMFGLDAVLRLYSVADVSLPGADN